MIDSFDFEKHQDICPTCGSNYLTFSCSRENWKTEKCNCFEQNKLWKEYTLAGIPNDYFSKTLEDYEFDRDATGKTFYEDIKKYCNFLPQVHQTGSGLFLHNELTATGKTFFAISILKKAYSSGYSVQFLPFLKIQNELLSGRDIEQFLKKANKRDFLVIDSVDRDVKKDFLTDIKLLNYFEEFLKDRVRPTIFTASTNLSNSNYKTLEIVRNVFKNRMYELFIDAPRQFFDNHNYWNNITSSKKDILK